MLPFFANEIIFFKKLYVFKRDIVMGSFSIWHWIIVLAVVTMIFGTKKLRNLGGDVGGAIKSFKEAVNEPSQLTDKSPTDR
jgi:sec-independent protein translocase protein TatA